MTHLISLEISIHNIIIYGDSMHAYSVNHCTVGKQGRCVKFSSLGIDSCTRTHSIFWFSRGVPVMTGAVSEAACRHGMHTHSCRPYQYCECVGKVKPGSAFTSHAMMGLSPRHWFTPSASLWCPPLDCPPCSWCLLHFSVSSPRHCRLRCFVRLVS